jgi:O-antigen/teichoic acid export membrane protein
MIAKNVLALSGVNVFRASVQFGLNLLLAGFIPPAEYGLVTFTAPFIAFLALTTELGLSSALVRQPGLTREAAGGALLFTSGLGLLGAALLAAAAPAVGRAAHMPELAPVMAAMAPVVALSIASTAPRALLERRLAYGLVAGVEAAAVFVGATVALIVAWRGGGVWALVAYNLVLHAVRLAVFLFAALARRTLAAGFQWRSLRPMLGFGGWVLGFNLLNFAARNGDNLLIGVRLGAEAVGLYGLAYQFMLAPLIAMTWPASAVLLATLGSRQAGAAERRETILSLLAATALVSFPAMAFLTFGLATPARALLGPQWADLPGLVAVLAPVGAAQSLGSYSGAVLLARGESRLQFQLGAASAAALLVCFLAALPFGLHVFVLAYAATATAIALAYVGLILHRADIPLRSLLAALAPAGAATAAGLLAAGLAGGFEARGWTGWAPATAGYAAAVAATYALCRRRIRARLTALLAPAP